MADIKLFAERKNRICFLNRHSTENNEFRMHSHSCYEIIYFLSCGKITVDSISCSVTENTCCIIPPCTEHTEFLDGCGEIIFIGFEWPECLPYTKIKIDKNDKSLLMLFEKAIEEYTRQNFGYKVFAEALLDLLLITYTRISGKEGEKCKDFDYIRNYIEDYYNQKINFSELAKLSGYSYDYFRYMFKKKFGCSPQNYLINVRLDNACKQLKNTNLTCTEIAYNCGFSTSAQMSSMMKAKFKMTPKQLKNTD